AGWSTGEEVVTMCVLLGEMGVLDNASIVGTDIDQDVLERARAHRYSMKHMELNEKNYRQSGGSRNLSKYYAEKNGYAVFHPSLFGSVTYKRHDLVTGGVFGKFHLILCRNVMIYFNEVLQNDVLKKFHASLLLDGFLSIGSKESLIWCQQANCFGATHSDEKIYRKVKD
ncbi:MAG TPA: CheR family methyltransferase, partial [Chryseosolibacter sp.]